MVHHIYVILSIFFLLKNVYTSFFFYSSISAFSTFSTFFCIKLSFCIRFSNNMINIPGFIKFCNFIFLRGRFFFPELKLSFIKCFNTGLFSSFWLSFIFKSNSVTLNSFLFGSKIGQIGPIFRLIFSPDNRWLCSLELRNSGSLVFSA